MSDERVLIWSNKHGMWRRPNHCGYTTLTHEAGRYTPAEAEAVCTKANLDPAAPNAVICRGARAGWAREQFEEAARRPRADWPAQVTPDLLEVFGMPSFRCGPMAHALSTSGRDRSGRMRVRCSAAKESGTCPEPRTFYLDEIERAVLSGLRAELRAPAVLAEFVREYHVERQRLASRIGADRTRIERRLAEVDREADRIVDMLVKGIGNPERLDQRAKDLAAEEASLRAELAAAPEAPRVVALHPATVARYEAMLGRLDVALTDGLHAGDAGGATALRDLVDAVTVWPQAIAEAVWKLRSPVGSTPYSETKHTPTAPVPHGERW